MKTLARNPADGPLAQNGLGLYLLILMTVALAAGQARDVTGQESVADRAQPAPSGRLLVERAALPSPERLEGTIRELKVLPSLLGTAPELDWSSDDVLLERYSGRDFR